MPNLQYVFIEISKSRPQRKMISAVPILLITLPTYKQSKAKINERGQ